MLTESIIVHHAAATGYKPAASLPPISTAGDGVDGVLHWPIQDDAVDGGRHLPCRS